MIYYVCNTGSDSSDGKLDSPFRTIQCAANKANPGDTIWVFPGIYRERVAPPRGGANGSPISYRAIIDENGNRPIIRGSCIWQPKINDMPNIWSDVLDLSLFPDNSHIDGACPFDILFSVTPYGLNGLPEYNMREPMSPTPDPTISYCLGQVFVSEGTDVSEMYTQMPKIEQVMQTEKTWNYNPITRILTIHFPTNNIDSYSVEITNQRRLFAPHTRGLKYINISGFIFERCGNNYPNQFWMVPQNQQAGAVGTRSGKYWTIENNIIRYATGIGIDWGNEGAGAQDLELPFGNALNNGAAAGSIGHTIINNVISDNGAAGTASYMCKKFTFTSNTVTRNNNLKFYGKRRWESAGLKVHCPTDSVINNNIIFDNYCHGIWCDQGISTGIFDNNTLRGNQGSGINIEIGKATSGLISGCTFENNVCGITLVTAGGVTIRKNRFLNSQQADIQTVLFNRTADKWDSDNVRIYANEFRNSPIYMSLTPKDVYIPANRYMNDNEYYFCGNDMRFVIGKTTCNFMSWKTQWELANSGVDADERSFQIQ